ncbi:hypothetical protein PV963_13455 [Streptomyces coeruleorubidus]|uniref:hypothetical protein n=1 Tax=Streptomyces coeruleorubidus TaxID=116188 RepID=UPI00237F275D|nr:hypothetical protein [Streptomyces coeruleorubidus]WDV51311.1 hypothetical protein PV963_13455 [Streptomyces coeruleorubidus]
MDHVPHRHYSSQDDDCPRCCYDALLAGPSEAHSLAAASGLEALVVEYGSLVERHLLRLVVRGGFIDGSRQPSASDLVRWMAKLKSPAHVAEALPIPAAIAVGVASGLLERSYGDFWAAKVVERLSPFTEDRLVDLWRDLTLLSTERYPVEAAGLRARVERKASRRPKLWARSLPWLLAVGRHLDGLDVALSLTLAEKHSSVRGALKTSARNEVGEVQRRAEGIRELARGSGPVELKLLDALGSSLDARRDIFPRPLDAPASTWLASTGLEGLTRGAVAAAVKDFMDFASRSGAQDEEMLTARLLEKLVQRFAAGSGAGRWQEPGSPEMALASRQETKNAEKGTGADIGIILEVTVPGQLTTRIGDLVQVKKANALIPSASQRDAWKIDRPQLDTLLELSPTATYWLIPRSGDVYAVPAKLLAAIGAAKGGRDSGFTVGHREIRHAAISLAQYLTDLTAGMWLGSTTAATLAAAAGESPTNRPEFFLQIKVTLPQFPDQVSGAPRLA